MAVYVLVSFEDDGAAKEFVKSVIQDEAVAVPEGFSTWSSWAARIRGVWKKPTVFCDPSDGHRKGNPGFTRGRKYGWWVCSKCGKPSKLWATGDVWYTALGTNLLPKCALAPEYRPVGWESPAGWTAEELGIATDEATVPA